ncbi:MAG: flagellar hook-basal body complex protein FliE [Burkholderiaceae bacterium]
MDINSIDQLKAALDAAAKTRKAPADAVGESAGASFGSALNKALSEVTEMQEATSNLQESFQRGDPSVSLEQTMVSMQKSQVAFQAALTVRNRLVSAYTDIMNMQV